MLVLTRRPGESIVIGGGIRIKVVEAKGGRVRLGIEAPQHVLVDRQEVHKRRLQFADPFVSDQTGEVIYSRMVG
jgi:carbon storage regulator